MRSKTVRVYLAFQFLSNLALHIIMATYVLFLLERGLNLYSVNQVNFCFMVAVLLLELPTGIIADLFGRRLAVGSAWIFMGLAGIVYYWSSSFWQFVVAEILAACGMSLQSGSLEAWVKDSLDHENFSLSDQAVFAQGIKIKSLASLVGCFISGWIAVYNLAIPWLIQGLLSFVAAGFAFVCLREEYFHAKKLTFSHLKLTLASHFRKSFSLSFHNKIFLLLVVVEAGVSFGFMGLNMQWSKHFEDLVGRKNIVVVAVGIQAAIWLGARIGEWLAHKRVSHKKQLFLSQLFIAVTAFMAGILLGVAGVIIFFLMHEVGRGLQHPVRLAYINGHIPARERATLLSFDGMVSRAGAALGLLISGWLANSYSISLSWQMSAAVIAVFTTLLLILPNGK